MFCTNCGKQIPDATNRCPHCGAYPGRGGAGPATGGPATPSPNPNSYVVASVVLCLCWCLPLGLVSLIYAAKGSGLVEAGQIARASEYGRKARMWAWIGFGAGLLIWGGYALLMMAGVMAGVSGL
jgi:hypothetical protein